MYAANLSTAFTFRAPLRIVIHLSNPQPPVDSESDRHRAFNQGLRCNKLDVIAGLRFQGQHCVRGSQWFNAVGFTYVYRRCECLFQLLVHGIHNDLLNPGRVRSGDVIVDHRAATFVTAFAQDPFGRNISRTRIGIRVHPDLRAGKFLLETQRVVDHHFARQKDPGKFIAECDALNRIADFRHQRFATIQSAQLGSGMISDGILSGRSLFPLSASGQRSQRQSHSFQHRDWSVLQRLKRSAQQSLHFFCQFLTETIGHVEP